VRIKGELKELERDPIPCPEDGFHVVGGHGYIRGVHAVTLGNTVIPKGGTAFYVRPKTNPNKGYKVFYGLGSGFKANLRTVQKIAEAMERAGREFCPRVHEIIGADLDLTYRGKRIRTTALALVMEHVHWPPTFDDYLRGHPYQFDDLPDHNLKGFRRFVRKIRKTLGRVECKLGNVLYNTRLQRWMLVDIGTRR